MILNMNIMLTQPLWQIEKKKWQQHFAAPPIKNWSLFLHSLILNLTWLTLASEILVNISISRGSKITFTLGFALF